MSLPRLSTARHSSEVLWSGYDILLDAGVDEPKKLLNRGMEGIDLKTGRALLGRAAETRVRAKLENVTKVRRRVVN